jgi:type 1 glutamine amidotransferase
MPRAWLIVVFAVACGCRQDFSPTAPTDPTGVTSSAIRVLMLTATAGFRHDSIATARDVMQTLAAANNFIVSATDDAGRLSAAELSEIDVVMFALTSGELPLSATQRAAFLAVIDDGKGFIGIHSATDTLREWPDYGRLIGAYMVDHPWTQVGRVLIDDVSHAATGVRESFSIEEEFYVFDSSPRSRVQVLLRLDAASVGASGDLPIAWAHMFGSGRVYYNALGHFPSTWRDARFQSQLVAAIRWTARR